MSCACFSVANRPPGSPDDPPLRASPQPCIQRIQARRGPVRSPGISRGASFDPAHRRGLEGALTWSELQADIADLFDGMSRRDRWDRSNGALAYVATHFPSGVSRAERVQLAELEQRARRGVSRAERVQLAELEQRARPRFGWPIQPLPRPHVCSCCGDRFGTLRSLRGHQLYKARRVAR